LHAVIIGSIAWALLYATLGTVGLDLFARLYAYSPVGAIALVLAVALAIATYLFVAVHAHARSDRPTEDSRA